MIVLGILVVNLILAHLVGKAGEKKEIGYGTSWALSFFLSPIISMLFVINSKEKESIFVQPLVQQLSKTEIEENDKKRILIFLFVFLIIISLVAWLK